MDLAAQPACSVIVQISHRGQASALAREDLTLADPSVSLPPSLLICSFLLQGGNHGARHWVPCVDDPARSCEEIDLSVLAPAGSVVAAGGVLVSSPVQMPDHRRRYRFLLRGDATLESLQVAVGARPYKLF